MRSPVMKIGTINRMKIFSARTLSFVLLAAAIGVSSYLSYLKVARQDAVCLESGQFDCGTVLNSVYSEVADVPIAWLGLTTNLIMLTLLILEPRIGFLRNYGRELFFGVILFAFLYSVYLVYVQAFLIQAYCVWCLSHEAILTVLFGVTLWRLLRGQSLSEQVGG
jgi:uncharacterized membrane protein